MMTKSEVIAHLSGANGRFYVYHLLRPDGTPFYVGKGKNRRVFDHESEALGPGRSYKLNIIRHIKRTGRQLRYEIVEFFESEEECHAREIRDIAAIGRHDLGTGPLANLTDGGEGTAGLSEETKQRIDANLHGPDAPGERGIANRFFLKLCDEVRSVPVRPASEFSPRKLEPHRIPRSPTKRMASALVASAIANRVLIEPGCVIPRRFTVDDTAMVIENGVGADLLRAGLATLVPGLPAGDEQFTLDETACNQVIALSNVDLLLDAGILMPEE